MMGKWKKGKDERDGRDGRRQNWRRRKVRRMIGRNGWEIEEKKRGERRAKGKGTEVRGGKRKI